MVGTFTSNSINFNEHEQLIGTPIKVKMNYYRIANYGVYTGNLFLLTHLLSEDFGR